MVKNVRQDERRKRHKGSLEFKYETTFVGTIQVACLLQNMIIEAFCCESTLWAVVACWWPKGLERWQPRLYCWYPLQLSGERIHVSRR
jgi:hypothetical protein